MQKKSNLLKSIFVISILVLPATFALWRGGFFVSDDGNWMVVRFSAFYQAFRLGEFPIRFLPRLNNMYGYPVANFLYPLFMYVGLPIKAVGLSFVATIKVLFGMSFVLSGIFSILWLRKRFGVFAAGIGSLVYVYFPYHLVDVYLRGSLGEALALSVVPFVLWQVERGNVLLEGVGMGLLILSHNTLALLFLPIILLYQLLGKKGIKAVWSVGVGVGLSAFFWLPALLEKGITIFDKTTVASSTTGFIGLSQFSWVGIGTLVVLLLLLPFYQKGKVVVTTFFFVVSLGALFLTIPQSQKLWQVLPVANLVQFPFRLLSLVCLGIAYLSAFVVRESKKPILFGSIICVAVVVSAIPLILPKQTTSFPDTYYSTNVDTTTVKNEYMPRWVKKIPTSIPSEKMEIRGGQGSIVMTSNNPLHLAAHVRMATDGKVVVYALYYPGWKVEVDGRARSITTTDEGAMLVSVDKGVHTVKASFGETPMRYVADIISLVTLLAILGLVIKKRYAK